MNNINVVFDTNAYRNLTFGLSEEQVKDTFDKIREAEKSKSVRSLLSTVTLMELITHLADSSDPAYGHCKVATIGAYHHVQEPGTYRIVPHPELQLQRMLFDDVNSDQQEIDRKLALLAYQIHLGPADEKISEFKPSIISVKEAVEKMEQYFVDDMFSSITHLDSHAANWKLFQNNQIKKNEFLAYLRSQQIIQTLAGAVVVRNAETIQRGLSLEDYRDMANLAASVFRAPFTLFAKMLDRMTVSGYDMTHPKKKAVEYTLGYILII